MGAKPLASLSSGLLARKGHAKPAMRPQGAPAYSMAMASAALDDLGWNDLGAAEPPVLREREALAEAIGERIPPHHTLTTARASRIAEAALKRPGKAAFTVRLDTQRHVRLRLASAVTGRSAQWLTIEALDALLATFPEVEELASRLAPSASDTSRD